MIEYYLRHNGRELAFAALLSIVSAALSMVLLRQLTRMAGGAPQDATPGALAAGVLLVVAMAATNITSQTRLARLSAGIIARLRRDLSERFLALDYDRIRGNEHMVTSALIADVSRLAPLLWIFPQLLINVLTALFCLVYLGMLAGKLLALLVFVLAGAMVCSVLILRKIGASFMRLRDADGALFRHFHAIAEGKKELTLSEGRQTHFVTRVLAAAIEQSRVLACSAQKRAICGEVWWGSMLFCALLGVIYAGHALAGESPTTILQFVIVALFMSGSLNAIISATHEMSMAYASVRNLEAVGVAPWRDPGIAPLPGPLPGPTEPANEGGEPRAWQSITARNLGYVYSEDDGHGFSFGPVDLTLRRGETLFLVGGNGGGKSTLVLLLSGLLQPTSGSIEVDGRVVTPAGLRAYRRHFTGVFCDFFLFSHVVDRHGDPAPDERINAWLERLDLHRRASAVNGELTTLNLSQGQRKRLALTQCYIDDSDIYVFDEWAADQDPLFRGFFYAELLPELKRRGKTIVVVTHDDRYFAIADRVLTLEQGRLADRQAPVSMEALL